jgi:hypothetical protein
MKVCPNTNTQEWKNMVAHVGEREAYRAYIAHNYTIPNAISLTNLKKKVGLTIGRYSPKQQMNINRKIRQFNKENGTSHFVSYKPYGANTFTAELELNYLPVNKEQQADRDRRKQMLGYGMLEDVGSFENVFTPSESEEEAGQFDEEGDFIPPSYFPATERKKMGPKFQDYIAEKEADRRVLERNKGRLIIAKRNATTIEKKQQISAKLKSVESAIEKIEGKILELENLNNLYKIEKFAEEDMKTLEKIFSDPNPSLQDLEVARRLINIWQRAGNFSGDEPHIFYDPEEFVDAFEGLKEISEKFVKWATTAGRYNLRLIDLEEKITQKAITELFGPDININFNEPLPDIGFLMKNVMDISEVDNIMFQALATWVKSANFAAKQELDGIFDELDTLIKKTGLTDFGVFAQTFGNNDQRKTGEMVHRWSQEYFDWHKDISNKRRAADNAARTLPNQRHFAERERANKAFIESLREKTTVIDPRIMFYDKELFDGPAPTAEQKAAHEANLRELLGNRGYEEIYADAERRVEQFKIDLQSTIDYFEGEHGEDQALALQQINGWIAGNSPYVFAEMMEKGYDEVTHMGQHPYPTNQYIRPIPKTEEFYDNKFKEIEANDDYMELYNYMMELLRTMKLYLPLEKVNFMQMNSIPTLRKRVGELTQDKGIAAGFQASKDSIREAVRIDDLSDVGTPEERKEFQIQMLQNNSKRIKDYIELRDTKYRAENDGAAPDEDQRTEWRKIIIDEIAQEKSFDLGRVMKAFASTAVTYKHRSAIEDQVRILQEIVNRGVQARENAAEEPVRDKYGNVISDKGLKNLKEMFENFLDVAYWGYPSNRPEGKTKRVVLTSKEKEMKKMLEARIEDLKSLLADKKINDAEYAARLDVIEDQLATLGGAAVISKYGDIVLKYIQLKGMGWNVFAAFANIGFGVISNVIEASDGRNYSAKNFWKAQVLTLNSMARNYTFNTWDGINGHARKIRVLMNKYDTLKEAKNELYKPSTTTIFRKIGDKIEWANPYSPQSRSEYFNQAPVMIAMMMETIVSTTDGKEMSLWDAYNQDGTLKEGVEFSDEEMFRMKVRIDKLVKMNHGNYDPDTPLAAKRKFFGRAVSQFRTWAYQGFAERFKAEFKDHQLTNRMTGEDFVVRKGRYRSYISYMQAHNGLAAVGAPIDITLQLLRKLIGFKTTFDKRVGEDFTEVDAANMRKNMTEIVLYMFITGITLILKNLAEDDDDDEKKKILAANFIINQMGRLSTDIMFYTNPIEFERLFRNAIPAFSLVVDAAKFMDSAWSAINGEEDILASGPNKGKSRTWRDFKKLVPGPVQVEKIKSASQTIYRK